VGNRGEELGSDSLTLLFNRFYLCDVAKYSHQLAPVSDDLGLHLQVSFGACQLEHGRDGALLTLDLLHKVVPQILYARQLFPECKKFTNFSSGLPCSATSRWL
jgi:hypothetical protein